MKPHLLKVTQAKANSFSVRQLKMNNIINTWHYHPEVELLQFHTGSGSQFVGDDIRRFKAGDIVLVGSNLPHYWKFDEPLDDCSSCCTPAATVLHFLPDFWGDKFLTITENRPLKLVLDMAQRGLTLTGDLKAEVSRKLQNLSETEGPERIVSLIMILLEIHRSGETVILSSMGFKGSLLDNDNDRINNVYEYTFANFQKKISLEVVADISSLITSSFCRYFKSKTGKTYSQFLTEVRIGHACKLLMDDSINIKEVCYQSGFMNFSSFYHKFKEFTGKSPHVYRKAMSHRS